MNVLVQIGRYVLSLLAGELPKPINEVLLIIGGAPGGIEAAKAFAKQTKCDVCAVNGAIAEFTGPLFLAISMQETMLADWVKKRKYTKSRPCVIANDIAEGLDAVVALDQPCPSSAFYAALIGRAMGYQRIVLAGVELNREGERKAYEGILKAAVTSGALTGVESLSPGWVAQTLKGRL